MSLSIIEAGREHLAALVAMLHDDFLGKGREDVGAEAEAGYLRAFAAISADPNNVLYVALDESGRDHAVPVGMFQLTFIPGLSYGGRPRALVEGVRTRSDRRGEGIGEKMMRFAIDTARERGCALIQLTTNKQRKDAHRFYARVGFEQSHEGFKMML